MITLKKALIPRCVSAVSTTENSLIMTDSRRFEAQTAPVYVHEVHLLSDEVITDFSRLERKAKKAVELILRNNVLQINESSLKCIENLLDDMVEFTKFDDDNRPCGDDNRPYGASSPLWALDLVDLYICPRTKKISHTIQVIILS
jgi:hypothetical protein